MNSAATVFDRISGDATVTGELDQFNGLPAIFDDNAPDDFVFGDDAVIVIAAPTLNQADPTLTEQGWIVERDVRAYARHTGSNASLDALAERLRSLFHLQQDDLSIDGGVVTACTVTGPVASPTTDPSLVGRRITLRLTFEET